MRRLFRGGRLGVKSRFIRPVLREAFVQKSFKYLHSGMDISDGLYEDSRKLTQHINRRFRPLQKLPKSLSCSGEEYEMLVSFSPRQRKTLNRIAKRTRTPFTVFAKVTRGPKKVHCKANHF
jgi:thiamine-monophosphate kinase